MTDIHPAEKIVGLILLGVLITSAVCWYFYISALAEGRNPLPAVPRRPVPWGFLDLLFAVGIVAFFQFAFQAAVVVIIVPRGGNPAAVAGLTTLLIAAATAASLVSLVVILAAISFRTGATLVDLGIDSNQFIEDLGQGAQAFVMLAVPVFIIQAILTMWYPSNHPLIDAVKESPDPWLTLGMTALAAVVGAPLLEEFAFRVLLQGWMEALSGGEYAWPCAMLGASYEPPQGDPSTVSSVPQPIDPYGNPIEVKVVPEMPPATLPEPVTPLRTAISTLETNPYESPLAETAPITPEEAATPPLWPTFISAFLFAISHWSHGPDWIPLLFLALGLGYLYRQTHRVVPTIVVHFLLNATSITLFAISLAAGLDKKG